MYAPYASTCGWADQWAPEPEPAPERVIVTPGTTTRYRIWLDGKCVAQSDDEALTRELFKTIKRLLAAQRVATVNAETDAMIGRAA